MVVEFRDGLSLHVDRIEIVGVKLVVTLLEGNNDIPKLAKDLEARGYSLWVDVEAYIIIPVKTFSRVIKKIDSLSPKKPENKGLTEVS